MTRWSLVLTVGLGLGWGSLGAQDSPPSGAVQNVPSKAKAARVDLFAVLDTPGSEADPRAAERQMVEDIEIMRRVLGRELRRLPNRLDGIYTYGSMKAAGLGVAVGDLDGDGWLDFFVANTGAAMPSPSGNFHASPHPDDSIDGTYLKGYGVHFNFTLPVHFA